MKDYIPVIILVVIITIIVIIFIRNSKYKEYVSNNSLKLRELWSINIKYSFYTILNLDESYVYDNKNYYENISCLDYLIYQLKDKKDIFIKQIKCVDYNISKYKEYNDEFISLMNDSKFTLSPGKLNSNKLLNVERSILEKAKLKPCIKFIVKVKLSLSDLNGNIFDSKSYSFGKEDVYEAIRGLNDKHGTFYNNRDIWDALCRVERGKVSNKLRFVIYERDGWRCRCCGISHDRANLEIDHILPISKGGTSTIDNLQTLCERCNKEKGVEYRKY